MHPLTSKQFRLPADPSNKTDDTDLLAIHRAAANGFALREPGGDETHGELQLLARFRRDLVRKNATARNQIHAELDNVLPGLSAAVGNIFDHEPALAIARQTRSAQQIRQLGLTGLAKQLDALDVRRQQRSLEKILAWAESAPEGGELSDIHHKILISLDDDRKSRLREITSLERDMAAHLVRTPYVLLLSFPGINVVSAAKLAGEMGADQQLYHLDVVGITGRRGLASVAVSERQSGSLRRPLGQSRQSHAALHPAADRGKPAALQLVLPGPGQELARLWRRPPSHEGPGGRRFCRIAFRMVAAKAKRLSHPSCQKRHAILNKLTTFHVEHARRR